MTRIEIIDALDDEIARLQQAKELIRGSNQLGPALARFVANGQSGPQPARRNMSDEGRKRIAEAQRLRWAKQKAGK